MSGELTQASALPGAGGAAKQLAANYVMEVAGLAIGDATDYLRNLETISIAAQGVALELLIAEENPYFATVIEEAQKVVTGAVQVLGDVTTQAAKITATFGGGGG